MGRDGRFLRFDWARRPAPTLDDFELLARQTFEDLPGEFRNLCDGIMIRVADFPDDDVVDDMGLNSVFDLLGLFEGAGMAQVGDLTWTGRLPNKISLYRRPILDYWIEHDESLEAIVSHVLIHEIGHHFGLSDDDMDRIEAHAG